MRTFSRFLLLLFLASGFSGVAMAYGWTSTAGGSSTDLGKVIKLDSSGNIFVAGSFSASVDFNPAAGVANTDIQFASGTYAYLTKYNADQSYAWTRAWGGSGTDSVESIVVDAAGNIFVGGYFQTTVDFDPANAQPTAGAGDVRSSIGNMSQFITMINADGSYGWTDITTGGSGVGVIAGDAIISSIALFQSGNAFAAGVVSAGTFSGTVDFAFGLGDPYSSVAARGLTDGYLKKIDLSGAQAWFRTIPGTGNILVHDMALDLAGNIYAVGQFSGSIDQGLLAPFISSGLEDAFILKYNGDGTFAWMKTIGGTFIDIASTVTVDLSGNIMVGGIFKGTVDLDPGIGVQNFVAETVNGDAFLLKLDSAGTTLNIKTFGGIGVETIDSLHADSQGDLLVMGTFSGAVDFDPTVDIGLIGQDIVTSNGLSDVYLTKYDALGAYSWTINVGGAGVETAGSVSSDIYGNNYLTGAFTGIADFDPSPVTVDNRTATLEDIFIMQLDKTSPVLAEITPVVALSNTTTPSLTFESTEAGSLVLRGGCTTAAISATAGTNIIVLNTLADGAYATCSLTVTDLAGNISLPLSLSAFTIDSALPVLSIMIGIPSVTGSSTPSLTFSSDKSGTVFVSPPCSSGFISAGVGINVLTLNPLANGPYSGCSVTVTDSLGNVSVPLDLGLFAVDLLPPVLSVVTPVLSNTISTTPSFVLNSSEASSIAYGGGCVSVTSTLLAGDNAIVFEPLVSGSYAGCTVQATDLNGNVSGVLVLPSFIVDLVPPAAPVILNPSGTTNTYLTTSIDIIGTSERGGTVEVFQNGLSIGIAPSPLGVWKISTSTFVAGSHIFTAQVTDIAGNVSPVSLSKSYRVDPTGKDFASNQASQPLCMGGGLDAWVLGMIGLLCMAFRRKNKGADV